MSKAKVTKGNHLTVTTLPSGEVTLEWDWDALAKEVAEATSIPETIKPKRTRRKKSVDVEPKTK